MHEYIIPEHDGKWPKSDARESILRRFYKKVIYVVVGKNRENDLNTKIRKFIRI